MGIDKATKAVLADLSQEHALTRGSDDISLVRSTYDRVFSAWTAGARGPTNETWRKVDVSGGTTDVLVIEPASGSVDGTVLFIHGGGWSLGSALCYAALCRDLASMAQMRVLVADFPQAPEVPYPAGLNVLRDVASWAYESFGSPVSLVGDSAGGTLCAVLAADEQVGQHVAAQVLLYPVMDLRLNTKYRSRKRFGSGKYFLSNDGILGASIWYCGDQVQPDDPKVSPVLAADFSGLPPTLVIVPEYDPLRDEGERYAALLKKAGVRSEVYLAKGPIHGCASFSGRIAEGRKSIQLTAQFLKSSGG